MKKLLILLALLGACSGERGDQANRSAPAPAQQASPAKAPPGRLTTLTGLYEGGTATPRHQMCIVDGEGQGDARFGLVVWGANQHSCSGTGTVTREGDTLRLKMAGDEACTIPATISGTTVTMPARISDSCAYYCGARARMSGVALTQNGATREAAAKAKDLVGEPLCASAG